MNCTICGNAMDERAAQEFAGQFICLNCEHGNSDIDLLEALDLQTLPFDMFKDSFVMHVPQAGEDYGGFAGEDLANHIFWSEDTQCVMDMDETGQYCATVGNTGTTGLFDHCAAFIYIHHYLAEQAANAEPDSDELHHIARCFMSVWPWPQMSFDEWLHEHIQHLNSDATNAARTLLERF